MRRFLWWMRVDPEDLERNKRADEQASERLRETRRWAKNALDRDGFADALILIMRGGTS